MIKNSLKSRLILLNLIESNILLNILHVDSNLFVVFTSTDEIKGQLVSIYSKKKKLSDDIKKQQSLKQQLDKSTDQLANFDYMIDILKQNTKLKSFNEFLTKRSKTDVVYKRLLFLIIMQGYNKEPVDDTSINDLTEALNGNYSHTQLGRTHGGKRRTKKIKINKTKFHRKTRSIKRSKKNITRRR